MTTMCLCDLSEPMASRKADRAQIVFDMKAYCAEIGLSHVATEAAIESALETYRHGDTKADAIVVGHKTADQIKLRVASARRRLGLNENHP